MDCLHEAVAWCDCEFEGHEVECYKTVCFDCRAVTHRDCETPALTFVEIAPDPARTPLDRFNAFHKANPHVYVALRHLGLMMKRRGHKRIGIAMLFEQLRWAYYLQTTDTDGFKLNNNYRAYYARLLMKQEPELTGFFTTREKQ